MSRDASLRQRGGNRYSFGEHGGSVQGAKQGKFIIRNNLAQHWNACWGDGVTVVRPLPMINNENPQQPYWEPYRTSTQPGWFGDWMRRYDAIRNFGDPGLTLLISDRADPLRPAAETTPAGVLFTAISQAVKNKQDQQGWAAMLIGGAGRSAQLTRPSEVCLFQCAVMQHKQEMYAQPKGFGDDKPVMMELSQQGGNAFVYELNQMNEGVQCAENDWERLYVNGDPVALQHGRFATFYRLEDGDPRMRQQQAAAGWNMGTPGQHGHVQQQTAKGYGCFLEPTFRGMQANLEQFAQHIAQKVVPWSELLWFPTIEEQAYLIADRFPPDAILYGWRDHVEWIPETIKNRAVAQTVMTAPNTQGGWGGAWNPAGAPPPAGSLPPVGTTAPAFVGGTGFGQPPGIGYQQPAVPGEQQYAPPAAGYAQPQQYAAPPNQQFAPQQQAIPNQPMAPLPPTGPTGGPPPQMQYGAPPVNQMQYGAPPPGQLMQPAQLPPQQPQYAAPQQPQYAPPQQPMQAPPQQQYAAPPPQQQYAAPPPQQFAPPPQQAPQQAPPQQPAMSWAGQPNPAMQGGQPSPMGQTPAGFAPQQMQAPPVQYAAPPQQGMPPQGPPQQYAPPPAGGAPPSRAAAALLAAQNAAAVPPQQ